MLFLLGGIAAFGAGISGFLQYQFEGFAWEDIQIHLFGGVFTALGSFGLFFSFQKKRKRFSLKAKFLPLVWV
ncbi:hypothetical protein [Algoriphagus boritolerans]|uniref:hypothetical protein n=1 Tax=Algoriphagus boritolerans TaxID=308111 RepID=UPI000B1CE2AE